MRQLASVLPILLAITLAGCAADADAGAVAPTGEAEGATTAREGTLDFGKLILENAGPAAARPPTTMLTQAEALEDVRFLKFFLEYAHGPRPFLEASGHYDVDGPFAAVETAIRARPAWTAGELFDTLRPVVSNVPDGHMSMYLPSPPGSASYAARGGRHWKAYVFTDREQASGIDLASCQVPPTAKSLGLQNFVQAAGSVDQPVFLSSQPIAQLTCGAATLPLEEVRPSGRTLPNEFAERALDADTYYIRLHTFSPALPAVAQSFIAAATTASTYKTVVLDLRGNGGGDPMIFVQWLQKLGARGAVHMPRLLHAQSFAADVLANNFFEGALSNPQLDAATHDRFATSLAGLKPRLHADLAAGNFTRLEPLLTDVPDYDVALTGTFEGHVRVLVDARCASACEMSARFSKELPGFAVLSETNTLGLTLGVDPVPLTLPNSTITTQIPVGIVSRPERFDVDGVGITPQVWVEPAAMGALFP